MYVYIYTYVCMYVYIHTYVCMYVYTIIVFAGQSHHTRGVAPSQNVSMFSLHLRSHQDDAAAGLKKQGEMAG